MSSLLQYVAKLFNKAQTPIEVVDIDDGEESLEISEQFNDCVLGHVKSLNHLASILHTLKKKSKGGIIVLSGEDQVRTKRIISRSIAKAWSDGLTEIVEEIKAEDFSPALSQQLAARIKRSPSKVVFITNVSFKSEIIKCMLNVQQSLRDKGYLCVLDLNQISDKYSGSRAFKGIEIDWVELSPNRAALEQKLIEHWAAHAETRGLCKKLTNDEIIKGVIVLSTEGSYSALLQSMTVITNRRKAEINQNESPQASSPSPSKKPKLEPSINNKIGENAAGVALGEKNSIQDSRVTESHKDNATESHKDNATESNNTTTSESHNVVAVQQPQLIPDNTTADGSAEGLTPDEWIDGLFTKKIPERFRSHEQKEREAKTKVPDEYETRTRLGFLKKAVGKVSTEVSSRVSASDVATGIVFVGGLVGGDVGEKIRTASESAQKLRTNLREFEEERQSRKRKSPENGPAPQGPPSSAQAERQEGDSVPAP